MESDGSKRRQEISAAISASLTNAQPMNDELKKIKAMDRLELRRNRNQSPPVITVITDEIPAHLLKMIEEKKKKVQAYHKINLHGKS